jgi:large subunit ribosomal protein L14e
VGRVVKINYGFDEGKLATIVEILNDRRVLIDGPTTAVARQVIPIRRLTLTKLTVKGMLRGARSIFLKKQIEKTKALDAYKATRGAKVAAQKAVRANLTDFDRFKVMILKKRVQYNLYSLAKCNCLSFG